MRGKSTRTLHPHRAAVVDGGLRLSYEQFFARCDRWSAALQRLDAQRGDRVAYRARIEQSLQNPQRRTIRLRTSRAEGNAIRPALAKLKSACPDLPPIPTRVLTAGGESSRMATTNREAWRAMAERAGAPYTNVAKSGHLMPIDSPDVVVEAIVRVLELMEATGTTDLMPR